MINEDKFCDLLRAYVKAAIASDEWDRIAPVGMTSKQAAKEKRLHDAVEKAYDPLWSYVSQEEELTDEEIAKRLDGRLGTWMLDRLFQELVDTHRNHSSRTGYADLRKLLSYLDREKSE
jgi:hypothetical protein